MVFEELQRAREKWERLYQGVHEEREKAQRKMDPIHELRAKQLFRRNETPCIGSAC